MGHLGLVYAGGLGYPVFTFVSVWFPDMQPAALTAVKVFATFSCATISYYSLEQPCLKLKKKFSVIKTRERRSSTRHVLCFGATQVLPHLCELRVSAKRHTS